MSLQPKICVFLQKGCFCMKRFVSLAVCLFIAFSAVPAVSAHGCGRGGHYRGQYGCHSTAGCSHSWCGSWTVSGSSYEFSEIQPGSDDSCCWLVETQSCVCRSCGQTLTKTVRQEVLHQWETDEYGNTFCVRCTPHYAHGHQHTESCGQFN